MSDFELTARDGLARLGRFSTPHGVIQTPALLPVVHPDPARQPVAPPEFRRTLGLDAVITSSYITWRTPPLREVAESRGIHHLIGSSGPVMTDSGAFQQHAYGSVEVGPEEILRFQSAIGSDIATVLDEFTEPDTPYEMADSALRATIERAHSARNLRSGLLAVPVQGGAYADLRARSARAASEVGDVLAVGGVVPLFEQYRYVELVQQLAAARPELTPAEPVHLFGAGHPMVFALAALFGVDLVDSSAYQKFARRGRLLLPEGTVALEDVQESTCHCFLCAEMPLPRLARRPLEERERGLAYHNLLTSAEEMGRVRQAIRDGTLWELAERRATAHPALRAAMDEARAHPEVFLPTEPASRRAFREIDDRSGDRPSVVRFRRRVADYRQGRPDDRTVRRVPLRPEYLRYLPLQDRSGSPLFWSAATPVGSVPVELLDLYPVGPYLGVADSALPARHRPARAVREEVDGLLGPHVEAGADWSEAWTAWQIRSLLRWEYGADVAESLAPEMRGERSRQSGRLRTFYRGTTPYFHVGLDGIPSPTFRGAERLHELLPAGVRRVVVTEDAAPFVREGRTLFSRFVAASDPDLVPGTTALLVDRGQALLAIGRLVLAPSEMGRMHRGVAVVVTAHARRPEPDRSEPDEGPAPADASDSPNDL